MYFDQVWDATAGLKPRRSLPKKDITHINEGDVVQLECQVQRFVPGVKAPEEWVEWRAGLRLVTITRLCEATSKYVRETPSDMEDNLEEEDESLYADNDD